MSTRPFKISFARRNQAPLRYQHLSAKGDRVIADGLDALVQAEHPHDDDDEDGAAARLVPVA
jgi:hypothetical protein